MKKCAYCNKVNVKFSKEHVVNKTLLDKYYKNGIGYRRVYDKYSLNYLTVNDVCLKCNNEILSEFDEYFLSFYKHNIPEGFISTTSSVTVSYEFNKLSKWLLKTLYNIERKGSYEFIAPKMHRYREYIIGKKNETKLFKIYLELIRDVPMEEFIKNNIDYSDSNKKLNTLRIGNIIFESSTKNPITIKHITISNFVFHVFILDPGQHNYGIFKSYIEAYIKASNHIKLFYLNPNKSKIKLYSSNRTIIDILENTLEGNLTFIDRSRKENLLK